MLFRSVTVYRYAISSKLESFRLACELQDRGFALNNNDRQASAKRLYALGDQSQADIAKVLGVSAPTVSKWLSRTIKEEKEAKQKKAREMWLACATQEEIAEAVGVPQTTVDRWSADFTQTCQEQERVIHGASPATTVKVAVRFWQLCHFRTTAQPHRCPALGQHPTLRRVELCQQRP